MKILVLSSHTVSMFWFRMDMMKVFISSGCSVVAVGQESAEKWEDQFNEIGVKYRQIYVERNGINPFNDLRTLKSIKKILTEEKPNKIFAYQAKTVIYGGIAARKTGISEFYPLIAGLGSVFRGDGLKNAVLKIILKKQYKTACKNSKAVIFQNNDDRRQFTENNIVNIEKTHIINGSGVDLVKFVPCELPKTPSFLFIGRLIKDKGIMEYLEACRRIKMSSPDVNCMLVGPFDSNPSALKKSELQPFIDDNIITYYGEQADVREFLNSCTVYILPSYHEGTPKTILEAMATGRAVITTDAPGCRETVTDNENGFLVPVKNVSQIVEKMQYFIDFPDFAMKMGKKSRIIAEEKYDVNKVNIAILNIMNIQSR